MARMKEIIGIIAEYNPFHNGHLYHIEEIKKRYPDALLILVCNGYFLQRGEPSILSKESKTKIALSYGIDLTVELPVLYGTQSADAFAYASISILHALGVQKILFGSESDEIDFIWSAAKAQMAPDFSKRLQTLLDRGMNYPTALAKASNLPCATPNDLLGISYAKTILQLQVPIQLETILRTNDYHDTTSTENIVSAKNIRTKIKEQEDISRYLPGESANAIETIDMDLFFSLLQYKILFAKDLSIYLDVDEGIEHRILKHITAANTLDELIAMIKTKRYTYNRIYRMLTHILLGITKEDVKNATIDYIHILGFNENGKKHLSNLKNASIPLQINRDSLLYSYEMKAAYLYGVLTHQDILSYEIRNEPIIF